MSVKILTIDDSKTIRLIVTKAFKAYDCTILEGANGVEGLAVAAREKPDLILLDYTMPVMDGFETLTNLRSDPKLKAIPVIMLTAESGRDTVMKIAKLGVRDYVVKPFKEEVIVEKARRVVALKTKGEVATRPTKFEDAVGVLVVDDKPAILDQIRNGLANTPWKVMGVTQSRDATNTKGAGMDIVLGSLALVSPVFVSSDFGLEAGTGSNVDVILASLTLPNEGAYMLLQTLRSNPNTQNIPVLGLSVKTATDEQARATSFGFAGIVTKPIDFEELKMKVARTLGLDTTSQYFQQKDDSVVLTVPPGCDDALANKILLGFGRHANAAVDSGLNRIVIDLSRLQKTDLVVIKLLLSTVQSCNDLGLKQVLVGSDALCEECQSYEETRGLVFVRNYQEAIASFTQPSALASAAA